MTSPLFTWWVEGVQHLPSEEWALPMVSKAIVTKFKQIAREDLNQNLTERQAAAILDAWIGYVDKLAEIHHKQSKVDITSQLKNKNE